MANDGQRTLPGRKFPLVALVKASYGFVFEYKAFLPFVLFQPALAYLVLSLLIDLGGFTFSDGSASGLEGHLEFSVNGVALAIVLFLPASLLFVTWHRLILLAGPEGRPRWFYPPQGRHWKYFGYMTAALFAGLISLAFSVIAVSIMLSIVASMVGFVALLLHYVFLAALPIAYLILFAKLSFLFPVLAVDERCGIADSWYKTEGVTWPLSLGLVMCLLPGSALLLAMNVTFFDFIRVAGGVPLWLEAANLLVLSYSSLVAVTFVTFVFQSQSGWVQGGSAQA